MSSKISRSFKPGLQNPQLQERRNEPKRTERDQRIEQLKGNVLEKSSHSHESKYARERTFHEPFAMKKQVLGFIERHKLPFKIDNPNTYNLGITRLVRL